MHGNLRLTSSQRLQWSLLVLPVAAWSLLGCATARINQFRDFAVGGQAYTLAMGELLDRAGEASIDLRSALLANDRGPDGKDEAEQHRISSDRATKLNDAHAENTKRLELLADLRAHTVLLGSYFAAVATLADVEGDSAIGAAVAGSVKRLGDLGVKIKGQDLGGEEVGNRITLVSKIAVGVFRKKALQAELKARADTIAGQIELQRATLTLLGEHLESDFRIMTNLQDARLVWDPYIQRGALPANWTLLRKQMLTRRALSSAATAAVTAVENLSASFVALCEGHMNPAQLDGLVASVEEIIKLVQDFQKGGE